MKTKKAASIIDLYRQGCSIKTISNRLGVGEYITYKTLKNAKCKMRTPTAQLAGNTRRRIWDFPKEQLFELYVIQKRSIRQMKDILGIPSTKAVFDCLKRHAIPTRTSREGRLLRGYTEVEKAKAKTGYQVRGENHPNWKGGKTPARSRFYHSDSWFRTAHACKKRDSFTCQSCRCVFPSKLLRAHHIIYKINGGTDDISNLVTLCNPCHRKRHMKEEAEVRTATGKWKPRGLEMLAGAGAFNHPNVATIFCGNIHN